MYLLHSTVFLQLNKAGIMLVYTESWVLHFANISLPHQTGVQDYETFNDQLDSLASWVVEAEEALKVHDPNGSTDLTVILDRMQELKVCLFWIFFHLSISCYFIKWNNKQANKLTINKQKIVMSFYRDSCWNSAVWPLNWSVLMSLDTGSLSMIQRSNGCRTSTGAGQQPPHRPQRDSGMNNKR